MSLSTFFFGLLIVSIIAVFVRIFWLQLFILWIIAKGLFWSGVGAFVCAVMWMVFVEDYQSGPIDGFWTAWLFFFITFILIIGVLALILTDAFDYFKGFIRDILKK